MDQADRNSSGMMGSQMVDQEEEEVKPSGREREPPVDEQRPPSVLQIKEQNKPAAEKPKQFSIPTVLN